MKSILKAGKHFQKKFLDLYEYHAKELFAEYGVPHQRGITATTVEEAIEIGKIIQNEWEVDEIVIKAQVLAGGRGKGHFDTGFQGGVRFCENLDDVEEVSKAMLGNRLFTKQTPPEGLLVKSLYVGECVDFEREIYLALLLDRETNSPIIVASTEGGVEIEAVAKETPELIHKFPINIKTGPTEEQLDDLAKKLNFKGEKIQMMKDCARNLYQLFREKDLLQIEINPLVESKEGINCLDAKLGVDDNALFRQNEIDEKKDLSELDQKEISAKNFGLEYIALDGNIGCLVNGAGLAMSTMDIIKLNGGEPANFLDVGGGAKVEQVKEAFKIITADENVQAILVNIFGGIMKCDVVAEGIIEACKAIKLDVPLVVRLDGTNAELGKELLDKSGLDIQSAIDLDDAARKAVACLK